MLKNIIYIMWFIQESLHENPGLSWTFFQHIIQYKYYIFQVLKKLFFQLTFYVSHPFLSFIEGFTFIYLADTFIQRDLHCTVYGTFTFEHLHLISSCFPWELKNIQGYYIDI